MLIRIASTRLFSWTPTTYVFMENYRKLSYNYHQIASSVLLGVVMYQEASLKYCSDKPEFSQNILSKGSLNKILILNRQKMLLSNEILLRCWVLLHLCLSYYYKTHQPWHKRTTPHSLWGQLLQSDLTDTSLSSGPHTNLDVREPLPTACGVSYSCQI